MKLGQAIDESIKNGGQLMVKQAMNGKWIFHATMTFPNGDGQIGKISTTTDGAIENLEQAILIAES